MSTRECWLLGSRVKTAMSPDPDAQIILSWRPLPGYAPVMLAKKRFPCGEPANLTVREATAADMPAIRGLYAMTAGQAQLLPVRDGLWTAEGALVAVDASGNVQAYCLGSEMRTFWNMHEWGVHPEADVSSVASAFAAHNRCRGWQLRAEFAPDGGTIVSAECVYIAVPKPFLLGTTLVRSAAQLGDMIAAQI